MATIKVRTRTARPCPCGCGLEHVRVVGELHWPEVGSWQFFFALLAHDGEQRNLWIALGGAPARDGQDTYVSILTFTRDDQFVSRITDAAESPHRKESLFLEGVARLADRAEIFPVEAVRAWVFETVDELLEEDGELRRFLLEG